MGTIFSLRVAVVVLVIMCWTPWTFLQAFPIALSHNWTVVNGAHLQEYDASDDPWYFRTVFNSSSVHNASLARSLLGFFKVYPNISMMYYDLVILFDPPAREPNNSGVFYDKHKVIWRANQNAPVGENAILRLEGGNLVLRDNDTSVVWSTNVTAGKSIASADLQPTGNLVLRDAANQTLWESYDFPTDTLMYGQEMRHKMALVSGSSPWNTSEGRYRLVVETKALVLYSGSSPYWISKTTLAEDSFDEFLRLKPNGTKAYMESHTLSSRLQHCNNGTCDYVLFGAGVYGNASFVKLDPDGVLRWNYYDGVSGVWNQVTMPFELTDPCDYPAYCGPYGICTNIARHRDSAECNCHDSIFPFRNPYYRRQGCNSSWSSDAACGTNRSVDFHEVQNVTYFSIKYLPPSMENVSAAECKNKCLHNCSCAAAFFGFPWLFGNDYSRLRGSAKCFLVPELLSMSTVTEFSWWNENSQYSAFIKYYKGSSPALVPRMPRPFKMSAWKLGIIVSSGILLFLAVCICVVIAVVLRSRAVRSEEEEKAFLESLPGLPPRFSFKQLELATKRFSKVLGEGGFGTVYQGILPDGNKVAVKRLGGSRQGQKEFRAEVATIGGINHLRLVRLWGFCSEGAHRMLVYECMNNGSLDRWLFRNAHLEWPVRYQIAVDTAHGLSYLHQDCRQKILHLDVKPQNILLDDQFRAKVADFGMSKLFDKEMTEVVTRMRGTPGYLAPEWLLQTGITVKCDVYSYGMVLLEIVSGRKNIDLTASAQRWYLPAWAVQSMQIDDAWKDIVDAQLVDSLTSEDWAQVKKVVMVALWCIQDSPRLRPTMTAVVQMLEEVVEVRDPPLQYDFLAIGSRELGEPLINASSSTSSVDITPPSSAVESHPLSDCKVGGIMGSYCQPDSVSNLSPR